MRLVLLAYLVLAFVPSFGQEFNAEFKDRSQVKIGEACAVELVFRYPSNNNAPNIISHPSGYQLGKQLELLSETEENIKDDGTVSEIYKTVEVIAWDSGGFVIPPFVAFYNGDSIYSNSLNMEVAGTPVDIEDRPKDINGIYEVEWSWTDELVYQLKKFWFVILVLIIIILLVSFREKLGSLFSKKEDIITLPPYERSIKLIHDIDLSKQLNNKDFKSIYSSMSDALKIYIGHFKGISAMDLTSAQIQQEMSNVKMDPKHKQNLRRILRNADLAKFAKAVYADIQCKDDIEDAEDFIHSLHKLEDKDEE